ncbi:hypothetical protein [Aurantiacibacter suaedae]|uniref:hypothetical protein n=1 Tax=Aurantiacibacter suaedae TaxID=2545755 RepID=UPI0010F96655|nr:hypothetical protein [Aurantiacibacter suaedae]
MAYGRQKYIDQAVSLARSVKHHMPDQPIVLVTDRKEPCAPFDSQIVMDDYKLAGTVLKTLIYKYSPFEETLFIDSDCLLTRDCSPEIEQIRQHTFSPVVNTYLRAGDSDLWLEDVGKAVQLVGGECFPKFNGGVYFFRKSAEAEAVFTTAEEMRARQTELGILDFDSAGPGEETLFGLAMAKLGVTDLYNDHGRLMRTPLNSTGPIHLDVLGGECRFVKEGALVEPAIVHFCGEWIDHPAYRIAVKELARGKRLPASRRAAIRARYAARKLAAKVARKLR